MVWNKEGYQVNKLYVIHFHLPNGYIISTWTSWNESHVLDKISKNPEWKFTVVEDNSTHKIWDAR